MRTILLIALGFLVCSALVRVGRGEPWWSIGITFVGIVVVGVLLRRRPSHN